SLYAIVQRLHLDPIHWADDQNMRSLMGHPLYVAGYLALVFPLCLWQILRLGNFPSLYAGDASELAGSGSPSKVTSFVLAFYCFLAAVQLTAFFLAQKRGPLIALLAGLFFFLVLIAVCYALRRLLLTTLLVTGVTAAFLVLLNIPGALPEAFRS